MALFGFGKKKSRATERAAGRGVDHPADRAAAPSVPTSASVAPSATVTMPAVPQENVEISVEDLLAEADVYWTYGRFSEALPLYRWWLETTGAGTPFHEGKSLQLKVARNAVDAATQAQDFAQSVQILKHLQAAGYPESFLAGWGLMALRMDPGNFELIGFCNQFEGIGDDIQGIIKKEELRKESAAEKRARLWKRNQLDANRAVVQKGGRLSRLTWDFVDRGRDLLAAAVAQIDDPERAMALAAIAMTPVQMNPEERQVLATMGGAGLLEDDAGGLDPAFNAEAFAALYERMVAEVLSHPRNLGVQSELLRILHNEGLLQDYARWLLYLFLVLFASGNAGRDLRTRLLAAGKLLGPHPLWDLLASRPNWEQLEAWRCQYTVPEPAQIWQGINPHYRDLIQERDRQLDGI
ncbi:hypothetical protein [Acidithiobacillus caldus]|nr:hypothetical protein [Acidithiobacillus caldus]